jgi:hypothetical protein
VTGALATRLLFSFEGISSVRSIVLISIYMFPFSKCSTKVAEVVVSIYYLGEVLLFVRLFLYSVMLCLLLSCTL